MNLATKFLSVIPILLFTHGAKAQDSFTFGLGLGTAYSGLGVNIGLLSELDMKYISVGCLRYTESNATCGAGLGWIKTDLFDTSSNKHGLGVYIGAVGTENSFYSSEIINGVGLGYYYFFNGIADPGFNLGFTLVAGKGDNSSGGGALFQMGYQF